VADRMKPPPWFMFMEGWVRRGSTWRRGGGGGRERQPRLTDTWEWTEGWLGGGGQLGGLASSWHRQRCTAKKGFCCCRPLLLPTTYAHTTRH
jgi:hypothetical protein